MRFKPLFSIEIKHDYYQGNQAIGLCLTPNSTTLEQLNTGRILLQDIPQGIRVLIATNDLGQPQIDNAFPWGFDLTPTSTHFFAVTEFPDHNLDQCLLFSNQGLAIGEQELTSTPIKNTGKGNGFAPVAKIQIHPQDLPAFSNQEKRYQATFPVKSAHWKYYFLADLDTDELRILDLNANLNFVQATPSQENADPVFQSLQARFSGTKLYFFQSEFPLPYRDQALRNLQLLRDGHVLIQHLPNPEPQEDAVKIMKIQKLISQL